VKALGSEKFADGSIHTYFSVFVHAYLDGQPVAVMRLGENVKALVQDTEDRMKATGMETFKGLVMTEASLWAIKRRELGL
jgi:hypothetical protein